MKKPPTKPNLKAGKPGSLRIIAGAWRGRAIEVPAGDLIRPTADRVREALFNKLAHAFADFRFPEARVVDVFAGTGALGLEALSRGARYVDFVEFGPASLHALKANIAALRVREKTKVFKKDALPWAAALEADRYDIAFADPPYGSKMLDRLIETWQVTKYSRVLAVEHATDHILPVGYDKRIFEDTAVTLYRHAPPPETKPVVDPRMVPFTPNGPAPLG